MRGLFVVALLFIFHRSTGTEKGKIIFCRAFLKKKKKKKKKKRKKTCPSYFCQLYDSIYAHQRYFLREREDTTSAFYNDLRLDISTSGRTMWSQEMTSVRLLIFTGLTEFTTFCILLHSLVFVRFFLLLFVSNLYFFVFLDLFTFLVKSLKFISFPPYPDVLYRCRSLFTSEEYFMSHAPPILFWFQFVSTAWYWNSVPFNCLPRNYQAPALRWL